MEEGGIKPKNQVDKRRTTNGVQKRRTGGSDLRKRVPHAITNGGGGGGMEGSFR